ncbi:hypothetical protein BD413DRAFT_617026 [Trametes elegans]|nr:hypothetical protein BD413DRAFT_617026 [Trametes elegans]
MHGPVSSPPVVKDDELWFYDGDLVLDVKDSSTRCAFRVYRDILERASIYFRRRASTPHLGSETKLSEDGCPVWDVTEDPSSLKLILRMFFLGDDYFYAADEAIPVHFSTLSAIIRMSHKYDIPDIYEEAIARLKRFYPTNYYVWEDIIGREAYVGSDPTFAMEAVTLAHLTNEPSILPTAYLDCCLLEKSIPLRCSNGNETEYVHMLEEMSPMDLGRVMSGNAELVRIRGVHALALLRSVPCEFCRRPDRCALAVQLALQKLTADDLRELMQGREAFEPLQEWFEYRVGAIALCDRCEATFAMVDTKLLVQAWRGLPGVFDVKVDGWPDGFEAPLTIAG